jgi:hypothetical protein
VRGFINSYARFIGLNPKDILTQYGGFLENKVQDRPARDAGHSGYAFEKREGDQSRTILWAVLGPMPGSRSSCSASCVMRRGSLAMDSAALSAV